MTDSEENKKIIENYIKFVQENIEKFGEIGKLIRTNEVPVDLVYKALAKYYDVSLMLNTEYQRVKIEKEMLVLEYDQWYADRFEVAKSEVLSETEAKKTKPSLKEYEMRVKTKFALEYASFTRRVTQAECECDFFIRLRDTLNKYDSILVTLSANMRSEMKSLSIENRAESRQR